MVRVPAVLVGLMWAYACAAVAFGLTGWLRDERILVVALPLIAMSGGYVAGRWAIQPAPVPGLAIGIFILAARAGLGLGMHDQLLFYIIPVVALLEMIGAISGGLIGTIIARRTSQGMMPKPDFGAFT